MRTPSRPQGSSLKAPIAPAVVGVKQLATTSMRANCDGDEVMFAQVDLTTYGSTYVSMGGKILKYSTWIRPYHDLGRFQSWYGRKQRAWAHQVWQRHFARWRSAVGCGRYPGGEYGHGVQRHERGAGSGRASCHIRRKLQPRLQVCVARSCWQCTCCAGVVTSLTVLNV